MQHARHAHHPSKAHHNRSNQRHTRRHGHGMHNRRHHRHGHAHGPGHAGHHQHHGGDGSAHGDSGAARGGHSAPSGDSEEESQMGKYEEIAGMAITGEGWAFVLVLVFVDPTLWFTVFTFIRLQHEKNTLYTEEMAGICIQCHQIKRHSSDYYN